MGEPHGQIVKAFTAYGVYLGEQFHPKWHDAVEYRGWLAREEFVWTLDDKKRVARFWRRTRGDGTQWCDRFGSMFPWLRNALSYRVPALKIGDETVRVWVSLKTWERAELGLHWHPGNSPPVQAFSAEPALVRLACEYGLTGEPLPPFLDLLQDTFPELQPIFERAACQP
jgi:hypothetical protein